ncbi:MAG: helix-turn-helix transcriptional regulator [Balneolaceae bacterium]|nr:helix-turn-helix transcriptional regulator [Balneolaceae bacterium]
MDIEKTNFKIHIVCEVMPEIMTECAFIPQGKLARYLSFCYYSDGYTPPAGKERVLPSGSAQLIINLGANHFRHFLEEDSAGIQSDAAIIAGVNSGYIFLDPQTRRSTIGVVFKPGGIQALFGVPTIKFRDQAVSLSNIIKTDVMALRNQLGEAASPQAKFDLLEAFLLRRLDESHQPNAAIIRAIQLIEQQPGESSVSVIANQVGYSRRRFSTLFSEAAGIAPKDYVRIQRFQKALRKIRSNITPQWSQIALSCGYYDQAHFNRDFKVLGGLTPGQYLRNQTPEKNHLPA